MKNIYIFLEGGMGNQMFQYAFGLSMSLSRNAELVLDPRAITKNPQRQFALGCFNLRGRLLMTEEERIIRNTQFDKILKFLPGVLKLLSKKYVEPHYHFDPLVKKTNYQNFYIGYWQSEKYFKNVEEEVRKDFTIKPEFLIGTEGIKERITRVDSIAVHIRRGDYAADPHVQNYHGLCTKEYYFKALEKAVLGLSNPRIFVFTDDPEWAKSEISWPVEAEIVSGQGYDDIQEFHLMSCAKKIIAANSSFSWWAAWLSRAQSVYVPSRWFGSAPHDTSDLIPENWIKI